MMRLPHGIVLDSLHRVMTAQYPIDPTDAAHLKKESWAVFSPCDCAYTPGLAGAQAGVLQALPQVDIETAADLQRCQQSCEDSFDEAIASTSHVSRPADADALPTQHDDHERQRSHSEASTSDAVTYAESSPNRDGAIAEDLDERGSGGRTVGAGEQYRNGAVPFVTRRAASSSSREGQLTHARGVAEVTVEEATLPSQPDSPGRTSRRSPQAGMAGEGAREGALGYEQVGLAAPTGSSSSSSMDDSTSRVMRKALKLRQQQRDGLEGARRGADGAAASRLLRQEQQQQQPRQSGGGMRCSTYALEAVDAEAMCAASDVACHRCASNPCSPRIACHAHSRCATVYREAVKCVCP